MKGKNTLRFMVIDEIELDEGEMNEGEDDEMIEVMIEMDEKTIINHLLIGNLVEFNIEINAYAHEY
jgi:hypothetical protein